jgi:hypothetical protein
MPRKGSPLHTPLVLRLLNNREEQLAAEALKHPNQRAPAINFFRWQSTEEDVESIMAWVEVFCRVFSLSLVSGGLLLLWLLALKLAGY